MTMLSALKIFFRFFPKGWWIMLLIGIVSRILLPEIATASNLLINVAATFLLIRVSTLIHEYGHLLAAEVAGGTAKRMILGVGHEIFRMDILGVKIIINSIPTGGMAWATFDEHDGVTWRYALHVAGGVLLNLAVALIFYLYFGFNPSYFTGRAGVDIASAIVLTNLFCVINLLPFYTSFYGPRHPTDGLILLQLLLDSNNTFKNLAWRNDFFNAYEHLDKKEYEKAHSIFLDYNKKFPDEGLPLLNISVIQIRMGHHDEGLQILNEAEKEINTKRYRNYKGYIYNNLASIYLSNEDIALAYHYATLALKFMRKNSAVWNTYGAVLIQRGDLLTGMRWLLRNVDFDHPNSITLGASMYLMIGFHQRGDMKMRDIHLNFVRKNIELLEIDERMIFERNLKKIIP